MMMLLRTRAGLAHCLPDPLRGRARHCRYIDGFYNPVRRHSALDFISPIQFERRAAI
jgi:transposase InsO family protein